MVLLILVVQVCNIIVTYARCLIVLSAEEDACLGKVDQGDHLRLLLHEVILSELVVRDEVTKFLLQVFNVRTLALGVIIVQRNRIDIILQDFCHAHIQLA